MAQLRRDEIFTNLLPTLIEAEVERKIIAKNQREGKMINKVGKLSFEVVKPNLKIKTIRDLLFKSIGKF